jgi:flavin-dependent dehydrogenase
VTFNYGGAPVVVDVDQPLYAPRRTVLDPVLVDAAREAGADVRFGVHVTGVRTAGDGRVEGIVVRDADGAASTIDAAITVGADGMRSGVAQAVRAPVTLAGSARTATIYGYYRGVPSSGYEWFYGTRGASGVIPTNDGRVLIYIGATPERFERELRHDRAAAVRTILHETSPELAARVAAGRRVGPLRGFPGAAGWLRRPFGDGWALVGDAGGFKDPLTAHGMTAALRDAELLANAVDQGLRGPLPMQAAMAAYERTRDDIARPLLQTSDAIARFNWKLSDLQSLHLALSRDMKREAHVLQALPMLEPRSPLAQHV